MEAVWGKARLETDTRQIMHYSRIMPLAGGQRYHTSTSVFLNEVIKLAISLTVVRLLWKRPGANKGMR